jgi:hypothetical protein
MKLLFTLFLTILVKLAAAQFAIVSDKDGYCNVRSEAATGNNIAGKLQNGHLVYCFESKGNWTYINYAQKGKEHNGYVYTDRLTQVSGYTTIPVSSKAENSISFQKDAVKITLTQQQFNKQQHQFSYYKDAPTQIELIDGKQYWGTDGGLPTTAYQSVVIQIGTKTMRLPAAALSNLFEPSLYSTTVNYDQQNDILYIQSMNSDGAGAYGVVWRIEKGVYKDRYIAYGF